MLRISCGVVSTMTVNNDACIRSLDPEMLATDLAYYLVRKGVKFILYFSIIIIILNLMFPQKFTLSTARSKIIKN